MSGAIDRITINLLENHSSVVNYRQVSIENRGNYYVVAGENNATVFYVNVPATMSDYTFTVEMVNAKGYGVDPFVLSDDKTFTLPKGMCVAGYGQISITATKDDEHIVWLPIKVKVWETLPEWEQNISKQAQYATSAELQVVADKVETVEQSVTELDEKVNTEIDAALKQVAQDNAEQDKAIQKAQDTADEVKQNLTETESTLSAKITAEQTRAETEEGELQQSILDLQTDSGNRLSFTVDPSNYVLTAKLLNSAGTALSTQTVDLPLESVVVSGKYDKATKSVVLTLQNGTEVKFSVADLVSGLVSETNFNETISDLDERKANKTDLPSSLPPSGTAGGDLTGTYPNPTVADGKISKTKLDSSVQASLDKADNAVLTDSTIQHIRGRKIHSDSGDNGICLEYRSSTNKGLILFANSGTSTHGVTIPRKTGLPTLATLTDIPSVSTIGTSGKLADGIEDTTHRLVTDTEKEKWNNSALTDGSVTRAKLDSNLQSSIDKANSALQSSIFSVSSDGLTLTIKW